MLTKICKRQIHKYDVSLTQCPECKKLYRFSNKEKYHAQNKQWADKNKQYRKTYKDNYNKLNSKIFKVYYENHKQERKAYENLYAKNNSGKINAKAAHYRACKLKATPKWLSTDHFLEIIETYELASELSWLSEGRLHVDHIVPLQGKEVKGLHVPWNLRIIPGPYNCSKSNKLLI